MEGSQAGERPEAPIGRRRWAIPEGYIPGWSRGPEPEMVSHEALCVLNAGDREARLEVTIYYEDREPAGPYHLSVPPRRTRHFRLDHLTDPEPIPRATPYASVVESDVPVVVQYSRIDTRQAENALLTSLGFAEGA
jgi:hypothetical protein